VFGYHVDPSWIRGISLADGCHAKRRYGPTSFSRGPGGPQDRRIQWRPTRRRKAAVARRRRRAGVRGWTRDPAPPRGLPIRNRELEESSEPPADRGQRL